MLKKSRSNSLPSPEIKCENPQTGVSGGKRPRTMKSELDRLLMDEGTVNMLSENKFKSDESKEVKLAKLKIRRMEVFNKVKKNCGRNLSLRERGVGNNRERGTNNSRRRIQLLGSFRRNKAFRETEKEKEESPATNNTKAAVQTYREIIVRKCDGIGHVTLTANSASSLPFSLNINTLKELTQILRSYNKDDEVKIILVNSSSNNYFCLGIDFSILIIDSERRGQVADLLSHSLRTFLLTLMTMSKVMVASVNGDSLGLGVSMLPYFDLVFASDKATFKTPYFKLGQSPEGLFLNSKSGGVTAMLYTGKRLTATEACACGLVTEVLWPAKFHEEVAIRLRSILLNSVKAMESTKSNQRKQNQKLESLLEKESKLLASQWSSSDFQQRATQFIVNQEF